MSVTPCIYCHSLNSELLFSTTDTNQQLFFLRECHDCQCIFLSPQPTAQQLAIAYDDRYYGDRADKFDSLIERFIDHFRWQRARFVTNYLEPNSKILDIGCGNGRFLSYMMQLGNHEGYGIELSGKAAKRAAQVPGIQLKEGILEVDDFPANTFDAITMVHVFEHVNNPKALLGIMHQILKPGGILVLFIPNIDSWQARLFKGDWLHLDPPRHLFFFRPNDLQKNVEKEGFDWLENRYFSPEYNPFGVQQSILNKLLTKREVLYEHLKGNEDYVKEYAKGNLWLQKAFAGLSLPLFFFTDLLAAGCKKGGTVVGFFRKR